MQGAWLIAFTVQWVMVLILALLVIGILRHLVIMEQRWNLATPPISAYEKGQRIAEFELPNPTGTKLRSSDLLDQSDGGVILFVSASRSACVTLLTQVAAIVTRRDMTLKKSLIVIGVGGAGTVARLLELHPDLQGSQVVMLSDDDSVVLRQFGITAVPTALAVDRQGRVIDQNLNPHVEKWLYAKLGAISAEDPTSGKYVSVVRHVPVRGRG